MDVNWDNLYLREILWAGTSRLRIGYQVDAEARVAVLGSFYNVGGSGVFTTHHWLYESKHGILHCSYTCGRAIEHLQRGTFRRMAEYQVLLDSGLTFAQVVDNIVQWRLAELRSMFGEE